MKKTFALLVTVSFLFTPTNAFGAVKSGSACKPLNTSKVVSGIRYTCIKSKGKLIWNKGVSVAKPTASATPTVVASESSPTPEVTTASPTPSPSKEVVKDVTAGAFCTPAGASGLTKTGLPVTCKTSATDTRNRWRQ